MSRKRITEKAKLEYIRRKYIGKDSELTPRNISYELEQGHEFCYTQLMGREVLTIKND